MTKTPAKKLRGISWHVKNRRWRVKIYHNRHLNFGEFADPILAACVYDLAAKVLKGPEAQLNWPRGEPPKQMSEARIIVAKYLGRFTTKYHLKIPTFAKSPI